MKLIRENNKFHVSNDTIVEFESTLLQNIHVFEVAKLRNVVFKFKFLLYRIVRKLGFELFFPVAKKWKNPLNDQSHRFSIMMGLNEYKIRPYSILTRHGRSVYLFDAWPHDHRKIIDFADRYKIDYLFVTASQSVDVLKAQLATTKICWVPEGIDPSFYKWKKYSEKSIDVLALGRKFDRYHDVICNELKVSNINYLYEKVKGELIFPDRMSFINGLANAKISICIPSSITHPDRAGNIETMTIRYLQSICSKCLIIGHAPKEMIDLFGYNPVVEIDYGDPVGQIKSILNRYDDYIPLIERNYMAVLRYHTWLNRWERIISIYKGEL